MLYRTSNKAMLAVLVAAMLGTFVATRADEQTSDLDKQIKEQQAKVEELKEKGKLQQAKAAADAKKLAAEAKEQVEQAKQLIGGQGWGFAGGQPPIRVRVQPGLSNAIHTAAAEVRDAKSDDDRKGAQKKLDEALSKYFDDDMEQREKELEQVEQRVAKLHELLEKRRASKQEIIDLESKVVMNQANGLGFYDNDESGAVQMFNGRSPFIITTGGHSGGSTSYVPKVAPVPPVPPVKPTPPVERPE